jgi:hypothetical protein
MLAIASTSTLRQGTGFVKCVDRCLIAFYMLRGHPTGGLHCLYHLRAVRQTYNVCFLQTEL